MESEEFLIRANEPSLKVEFHKVIVEEVRKRRFQPLFDCREAILSVRGDYLQKEDVNRVCCHVMFGFFSYDAKESLLLELLDHLQQGKVNEAFLSCLAAIMKKEKHATSLLRSFIHKEQHIGMCVMLASLHYGVLNDKQPSMLAVCEKLLERLAELPIESRFMEIINIEHIRFSVNETSLDYTVVR